MNNRRVLATTALTASVALAFAPLATAQQQEPKLQMPATVTVKSAVAVSAGPCRTFSTVTSPGLSAPITLTPLPAEPDRLQGSGTATARPGTYTATVQCDGKTLTAQFTVALGEVQWGVYPLWVEPGNRITGWGYENTGGGNCPREALLTSPGFAAPMKLLPGHVGFVSGETTVITAPGTYEVSWRCLDSQDRIVTTFGILGKPPAPTPPVPGKPKPPITKPKGAPDTGGGDTARRPIR